MIFVLRFADNIEAVLWVAVPPAFVAVFLLVTAVRERESPYHAGAGFALLAAAGLPFYRHG